MRIFAVAGKELRQVSRDPFTLLMLLGIPTMMLLLYGYALNFDVRHVRLAVQDSSRSRASRDLVAAFVDSSWFEKVADLPSGADLDSVLEDRTAKALLVIPENFSRELEAGRPAAVQLLLDGADATTAATVLGYAEGLVADLNVRILAPQGESSPPIELRPRVWFNPELRSTQFIIPGLIGFILMLTAVLSTALSIVREAERGTLEQLRVSRLSAGEMITGKTLPYLAISLVATGAILATARVLFGVAVKGSYLELFFVTLIYLLGALGLGLLVSSVSTSQATAFQLGSLLSMLPAIFLSGFIFPIRSMPPALQLVTLAVPARYFMAIVRGIIIKGAPLSAFPGDLAFLSAYGFIVIAIAGLRLTRRSA